MASSGQFVLFDATSEQGNTCWLPNPWKTRLLLNFKRISYKTEWLRFEEVGEKIKALGIPPNPGPGKPHTVPVLQFPNGEVVMDSDEIAKRVEGLYPHPSLDLDDEVLGEVTQTMRELLVFLLPDFIPLSRDMMDEQGRAWFEADRSSTLRMSCDEFARLYGGEVGWRNAKLSLTKLKAALNNNKISEGPFVRGARVTQADFVIVSFFQWARSVGNGAIYRRLVDYEPNFAKLCAACIPWLSGTDPQ